MSYLCRIKKKITSAVNDNDDHLRIHSSASHMPSLRRYPMGRMWPNDVQILNNINMAVAKLGIIEEISLFGLRLLQLWCGRQSKSPHKGRERVWQKWRQNSRGRPKCDAKNSQSLHQLALSNHIYTDTNCVVMAGKFCAFNYLRDGQHRVNDYFVAGG